MTSKKFLFKNRYIKPLCSGIFVRKMLKSSMNNKEIEKQQLNNLINELKDNGKNVIDIAPTFFYKGQLIVLDFISKEDNLFLEKIFTAIENNPDKEIDTQKIKNETKAEYSAAQIEMIQAKDRITRKEFKAIYNKSLSWQDQKRGRINDPLPYEKIGKTVYYKVKEIEKWLKNNED